MTVHLSGYVFLSLNSHCMMHLVMSKVRVDIESISHMHVNVVQALRGGQVVGFGFDLWSLGCVIFQMLEGKPPFRAGSEYLTFQRILALDHQIPSQWPSSAQSIIRMLLQPDPLSRLGKLYDPEKLAT